MKEIEFITKDTEGYRPSVILTDAKFSSEKCNLIMKNDIVQWPSYPDWYVGPFSLNVRIKIVP